MSRRWSPPNRRWFPPPTDGSPPRIEIRVYAPAPTRGALPPASGTGTEHRPLGPSASRWPRLSVTTAAGRSAPLRVKALTRARDQRNLGETGFLGEHAPTSASLPKRKCPLKEPSRHASLSRLLMAQRTIGGTRNPFVPLWRRPKSSLREPMRSWV